MTSDAVNIADARFKAAPFEILKGLRQQSPVCEVRAGRQTAFLVTRHEEAVLAFKHPGLVKDRRNISGSKVPWVPSFARPLMFNMLDLDDPQHRRLRALVQQAFSPRFVEHLRGRVSSITNALIDEITGKQHTDLIADFAAPLPTTVIAELLGVPLEDRIKFRKWTARIVVGDSSGLAMARAAPSVWLFVRYLRRLIAAKAAQPTDDLLGSLVHAEADGDRLTADELMAMAFLLLVAGHETTVNLISSGVLALLSHPEQLDRLRKDPALIAIAVEEVLRFDGPLLAATERYAKEDLRLGDVAVPKGALVLISIGSANRDERAFDGADTFDIGRTPNRHLAFGDGIHFCLGSALARMEGQIALASLFDRLPNLRLAVGVKDLRWKGGITLRGLTSLPVVLASAQRQGADAVGSS